MKKVIIVVDEAQESRDTTIRIIDTEGNMIKEIYLGEAYDMYKDYKTLEFRENVLNILNVNGIYPKNNNIWDKNFYNFVNYKVLNVIFTGKGGYGEFEKTIFE